MTILTRRRWRRLLLAAGLAIALWLFASWVVADQLTRRHGAVRPEPLPAVAWGTPRDVRLETVDGERLGAWFFAGRPDRQPVLLLHGNGGSRADCLDAAEFLVAAGHPALLVTLRCHGDSTGERNDFGYSARRDVVAAIDWLAKECPGRVVVWGRSLGSAAAVFAAHELGERVGGYVLECPYRDLRTAVRVRTQRYLFWPADRVAYAGLAVAAPLVLGDVDRISPIDASAGIPHDVPVLILAGGADPLATPAEAAAIGERIGPRAEVVVFPGAGHVALFGSAPARYRELGLRFVAACPK